MTGIINSADSLGDGAATESHPIQQCGYFLHFLFNLLMSCHSGFRCGLSKINGAANRMRTPRICDNIVLLLHRSARMGFYAALLLCEQQRRLSVLTAVSGDRHCDRRRYMVVTPNGLDTGTSQPETPLAEAQFLYVLYCTAMPCQLQHLLSNLSKPLTTLGSPPSTGSAAGAAPGLNGEITHIGCHAYRPPSMYIIKHILFTVAEIITLNSIIWLLRYFLAVKA